MIEIYTLPNGIRLIVEPISNTRKAAVSCYITAGSQNEPRKLNGLAHFVEHGLCLGTQTKSEEDIKKSEHQMGTSIDASTDRVSINLSTASLSEDFKTAYALMADLICHPIFPEELLERERSVILTELAESETDELDDNLMYAAAYKQNPLGLSIGGTKKTVQEITRQDILDYYQTYFRPENLIISIVGDVNTQECMRRTMQLFQNFVNQTPVPEQKASPYLGGDRRFDNKDETTATIRFTFQGIPASDERSHFAGIVFAEMLEDMLFEELRNKKGLIYSVYAKNEKNDDNTLFYMETTCEAPKTETVIHEMCHIINQASKSCDEARFKYAQKLLKLNFENDSGNLQERAELNCEIFKKFNKVITPAYFFELIDSLTPTEITQAAQRITSSRLAFSCSGNIRKVPTYQQINTWLHENNTANTQTLEINRLKPYIENRCIG